VDDEDIRYLDKVETKLNGGEIISIVPSIAGGSTAIAEQAAALTNDEIARFSRHLILPEVGIEGQTKLKQAKVAMIGAGGLGAPLGLYLAAAGVGRIGLVDFDVVDVSNLQRQVIHGTRDIGRKKLDSAADRMQDINPNIRIDKFDTGLNSDNAFEILRDYDIVVDGTDNFPTRYLVNDACVLLKKPNVYGSIFRFEGQATVFAYQDGPCYRCLYPEPPPPALVPSASRLGPQLRRRWSFGHSAWRNRRDPSHRSRQDHSWNWRHAEGTPAPLRCPWHEVSRTETPRDKDCPVCGDHPTVTKLIDYQQFCGINSMPNESVTASAIIDALELKEKINRGDNFVLLDVREPHEYQIARIPGSILIPLGDLPKRLNELDKNADIVAQCKSGGRSQKAVDLLKQSGFQHVRNMTGGITAWSDKVDPTVPKY
jgi:adenylyltransferase/sulfurtransferase